MAKKSEQHKISKCSHLDSTYVFIPVAVETSGVFGPQSLQFIKDLGNASKQPPMRPLKFFVGYKEFNHCTVKMNE